MSTISAAQLEQLRRNAKRLARQASILLHVAQDRLAVELGFKNWSLLARKVAQAGKSYTGAAVVSEPCPAFPSAAGLLKPVAGSLNQAGCVVVGPERAPTVLAPRHVVDAREPYYLHGDQSEDNPSTYYCAQCDLFVPAHHFSQHTTTQNVSSYRLGLSNWDLRAEWGFRRPARGNLMDSVVAEKRRADLERELSSSPFYQWIRAQAGRVDRVGDLASDLKTDRRFPVDAASIDEMFTYLETVYANPDVVPALRDAYAEFLARK